jgi:acyl phosphate:glycerol-3-phosphate acyltransferase
MESASKALDTPQVITYAHLIPAMRRVASVRPEGRPWKGRRRVSNTELILRLLATIVAAYLLGGIPFGVLVGKLYGADPREGGSGKTGTTNVLRTLGRRAALLVLAGDLLKGVAAVLLARYVFFGPVYFFHEPTVAAAQALQTWRPWAEALAGLAAVLGHTYSPFIQFKGGRGVATGGGALLVISPLGVLFGAVVFALVVWRTRYVSLGSILGAVTAIIVECALYFTGRAPLAYLLFVLIGGVTVIYLHKDNIQRLRDGTERKVGQPKAASA